MASKKTETRTGPGRRWPAGIERKTKRVNLKVRETDLDRWQAEAEAAGISLALWIERRCNGVRIVKIKT